MSADFMESNADGRRLDRQDRSGISPTLIAAIVIAILVVVFIVQNGNKTAVDFLWLDFTMPLWVVIAISLVAGAVLSKLVAMFWRRRNAE